jgi:cytochrome c553
MPPFLLAWERLLWSGRPGPLAPWRRLRVRYHVTNTRVIVATRAGHPLREILFDELAGIELHQSRAERLAGTATVVLRARDPAEPPVELTDLRQGPELALVLQLCAADRTGFEQESEFFSKALGRGRPGVLEPGFLQPLPLVTLGVALLAAAFLLSWRPAIAPSVRFPIDDAIAPGGVKRSHAEIVLFMQRDVMPVARRVLGPVKGGAQQVTCETCHGPHAVAIQWKMPAVRALPEPQFRFAGLERYNTRLDPQIRNAIYGYLAEEDKQSTAAYMRSVVMPAMARVLGRPSYDFTRSYEYNRLRAAIGCYHCHLVEANPAT